MEFCPNCGCVLVEKNSNSECPRCRYKKQGKTSLESSEKIEAKKPVAVIDEKQGEVHPIMDIKCPKCENSQAYFWMMQTRAGDEAPTKFFRCTKCKHTWRVYR